MTALRRAAPRESVPLCCLPDNGSRSRGEIFTGHNESSGEGLRGDELALVARKRQTENGYAKINTF